jgi:uncharacterized protein YukE
MSTYLAVSIPELQALRSSLRTLQTKLEDAVKSSREAAKTASWNGPAAERYVSEMKDHADKLERALEEVCSGVATITSEIGLAEQAKAAERRRLAQLAQEQATKQ